MRLFLALELPPPVAEALADGTRKVRVKGQGVRWVDPSLWHLTLKFLGEVPEGGVPTVTGAVGRATEGVADFSWTCRGLGAFPDLHRPRVLWAGVGAGREAVIDLAGRLEHSLGEAGFPLADRPFHPHVTLGRAAGSSRGRRGRLPAPVAGRVLESFAAAVEAPFGGGAARQVVLVASTLRPEGPHYETVRAWALGGQVGPRER